MLVVNLVDANQHALLILAHVGETFQIHHHRQFMVKCSHFWDIVGQQVVMLQRGERQIQADHAPDLFGPESAGIDHVLGMNRALVSDHIPTAIATLAQFFNFGVFDDSGTSLFGGARIGVHSAGRIHVTLAVAPQPTDHTGGIHDRALVLDFPGCHQVAVFNADGLEDAVGRLQPFPPPWCRGDGDATGHAKANVLSGFGLDLG